MIRRIALVAVFLAAGLAPVLAQTQARPHPPHPQGQPHDPAHPPMDPALHAALHARLVGNWSGTLTAESAETKVQVVIASDKSGQLTIKTKTSGPMKAGDGTAIALDSGGLRWTQPMSGMNCKATAALEAAAHHGPDTMKGTMTCGAQEMSFAVTKLQG